jgi:hypothetical protein
MRFAQFNERCWTGYRQAGMKNKSGRQVPNCVPVTETRRDPKTSISPLMINWIVCIMNSYLPGACWIMIN